MVSGESFCFVCIIIWSYLQPWHDSAIFMRWLVQIGLWCIYISVPVTTMLPLSPPVSDTKPLHTLLPKCYSVNYVTKLMHVIATMWSVFYFDALIKRFKWKLNSVLQTESHFHLSIHKKTTIFASSDQSATVKGSKYVNELWQKLTFPVRNKLSEYHCIKIPHFKVLNNTIKCGTKIAFN